MALKSISIVEFKKLESTELVQIVKNPHTEKLFAVCGNGNTFKAQATLDADKPVAFLYDDEVDNGWAEGCIVNPSEANVVAAL